MQSACGCQKAGLAERQPWTNVTDDRSVLRPQISPMPFPPPPSEPDIDADALEIATLKWLNPAFLEQNLAVPIGISDGRLVLAMAKPDDQTTIDALHFASGRDILPVAMDAAEISGRLAIPVGREASANEREEAASNALPCLAIEQAGCRAFLSDGAEMRLAHDDDRAAWLAITPAFNKRQIVDVLVPHWAMMQIDLQTFPQSPRHLHEQLTRLAPVMPSQLAWTQPQISDGANASVTVVRRAWLDQRLGAIERASGLTLRAVTAAGHVPLQYSTPRARLRNRLMASVLVAALVGASAVSWISGRSNSGDVPRNVAQTKMVRTKPAPDIGMVAPSASLPANSAGAPAPPTIVGIVGRLPDGAEVLVRTAPGKTSSVKLGETVSGWQLVGVAADRATFEIGGLRREVVLKPVQ